MTENMTETCPYDLGDVVRFTPSNRTRGLYQNIERFGIAIGEEATILEVRDGVYLYFVNGAGGFPWNEYSLIRNSGDTTLKY